MSGDTAGTEGPRPPQASPDLVEELAGALRAAVGRAVLDRPQVSLLFSGGLDSSLLAHLLRPLLREERIRLDLVTIGIPGAADLDRAEESARALGLPWEPRSVSAQEVRAAAQEVRVRSQPRRGPGVPLTPVSLEVQTGLFLALQRAQHPTVLCGQGADELFLGYAHFRPLPGPRLRVRYDEDLARLLHEDLPTSVRLARSLGLDLRAPYLDAEWRKVVDPVPLERRRAGGVPKALLREVALRVGLPAEIASAPKKALQYGSGVHAALSPK